MAKLSVKNIKQPAPAWMVNMTGILALLTPILPGIVNTMPAGVPQGVKDWILWGMAALTAVSGSATMFAKSSVVGSRPDDRNKP